MRIQNNSYLEYKTSTFRATSSTIKMGKAVGSIGFSTFSKVNPILEAVKNIIDIYAKNLDLSSLKQVLAKQGITIGDTIKFASFFGIGTTLGLYPAKTEDGKEALGMSVENDSDKFDLLIQNSQVIDASSPEKKYMSQYEVNESGVEECLDLILSNIDFPLLQIRTLHTPNMSEVTNRISVNTITPSIAKIRKVLKEKSPVINEMVVPKKNKPVPFELLQNRVFNNTLGEVNYMIEDSLRKLRIEAKNVNHSSSSTADAYQLGPEESNMFKSVLSLFKKLEETYQRRGLCFTRILEAKCPIFDFYRKNSILNLKNIGDDNLSLGLFITRNKEINQNPIYTICLKDKEGYIIDVVSILNNKILKIDNNSFEKIEYPIDLKVADKFMTQGKVASKNILGLLTLLKTQMERLLTSDDSIGIEMNSAIADSIKDLEERFSDLNVNLSLAKSFKQKPYLKHKSGGYTINNINAEGDTLMFTPASENKEIRGVTAFRFFDKSGNFLYGYAVKDGKVLTKYPCKTFSYAMNVRYSNVFEMENLNLEEKIKSCVDLLNSHIKTIEKSLKVHEDSRDLIEKFPF